VLILLPPSEKKNIPAKGPRLILTSLSFSKELSVPREIALKKYGKKITEAPTAAAINIYTGVLYQSLDWQQLSAAAKKRGEKSILIVSALFGVLAPGDKIPSYKSKIEPRLWRKPLADALGAQEDELIVDCRSSTYSTVWSADPQRCVEVRVFQKKAGKLSVITHMSKKYRGELANLLISQSKNPKTAEELCAIASKKFECKLHRGSATKTSKLDLIISV
jgi:cytoplasmic iron level regulating protein YaaA (DUF328/UPF0246 family)